MPLPSLTLSVTVERPAGEVYPWLSRPENWPAWASGLGQGLARGQEGWTVDTPEGQARIRFSDPNSFGVLDHCVRVPAGTVVHVPMRVIPNQEGCDVILTLFRQPSMSDEAYAADADWVRRDLANLKRILEARPVSAVGERR